MAKHPWRLDPALLKLQAMKKNRRQFFRWNARTTTITIMYMVVVPAIVGYIGYKTDGLIDLRGKRNGDTILER